MQANKIECGGCGTQGEFEIEGLVSNATPEMLFRYLGHHEFTGNMYFLCPQCRREVVVNPMEVLEAPELIKAKAYMPPYASTEIIRTRRGSLKYHAYK